MLRASLVFPIVAGALVLGASVQAKQTSAGRCERAAMKSVFPKAATVGFESRASIVSQRRPPIPRGGWCGSWSTTYKGRPGRPDALASVVVGLYKSRAKALRKFAEARVLGPAMVFPNGVRLRAFADSNAACVASVVRTVFIMSAGRRTCLQATDYPGSEAVAAQMRIHRRIHAAVLRLG